MIVTPKFTKSCSVAFLDKVMRGREFLDLRAPKSSRKRCILIFGLGVEPDEITADVRADQAELCFAGQVTTAEFIGLQHSCPERGCVYRFLSGSSPSSASVGGARAAEAVVEHSSYEMRGAALLYRDRVYAPQTGKILALPVWEGLPVEKAVVSLRIYLTPVAHWEYTPHGSMPRVLNKVS